jgi:hypothetical protein
MVRCKVEDVVYVYPEEDELAAGRDAVHPVVCRCRLSVSGIPHGGRGFVTYQGGRACASSAPGWRF